MHRLALLQNPIETIKNTRSDRPEVKGFRTGFGLTIPQEQAAFMTDMPDLHVGNPDPEDEGLEDKINTQFEPWIITAWDLAQQAGQVWARLPLDLKILGRAWDSILPHPFMWADEEYKAALAKRNTYTDETQIKKADRNLQALKAKKFPIRWVYVPPRTCWSTFESEHWLPEVVEARMMLTKDIKERWGDNVIPGPQREYETASSKTKVYIWTNHCYSDVVIPDKEDPKLVGTSDGKPFYHGFYRSPYNVCEAQLAPENDLGVRWLGMMFGARYMINSLDELMSDQRELIRDYGRTPRIWQVDMEMRGEDDPLVKARAAGEPVDVVDGSVIGTTEKIVLAPVPEMNPVTLDFQRNVQALIERVEPPGIQRAEVLSGQSQNTVRTSFDIANKAMGPHMKALSVHAKSVGQRLALSVVTMDDVVPAWSYKGSVLISLSPQDAEYVAASLQATVGVAIPTDANSTAQVMNAYQNQLGYDPVWVGEKIGHIENSDQVWRMSRRAREKAAVDEQVIIPMMIQRLQQIDPTVTPEQMAKIKALFGQMPPDVQDFLAAPMPVAQPQPAGNPMPSAPFNGATGGGMSGPDLQGAANLQRPEQQPQMPGVASGQQ